jgi:hypothetical protein
MVLPKGGFCSWTVTERIDERAVGRLLETEDANKWKWKVVLHLAISKTKNNKRTVCDNKVWLRLLAAAAGCPALGGLLFSSAMLLFKGTYYQSWKDLGDGLAAELV